MKITKRVHQIWKEWDRVMKTGSVEVRTSLKKLHPKGWVDKWQYLYSHNNNEISLILLYDYDLCGNDTYEIYCTAGNLFDDVERFETKDEAEIRIKQLLGVKK